MSDLHARFVMLLYRLVQRLVQKINNQLYVHQLHIIVTSTVVLTDDIFNSFLGILTITAL